MITHGGLLTDFPSGTVPDRENFPSRNRIVAGMADATVVIESGDGGWSLITAGLANSYNRDVYAFPGDVKSPASAGCHHLIRKNGAGLITCAADLLDCMGWSEKTSLNTGVQKKLFVTLSPDEEKVVNVMSAEPMHIDTICYKAGISMSRISSILLSLEFSGLVKALPGKMYRV